MHFWRLSAFVRVIPLVVLTMVLASCDQATTETESEPGPQVSQQPIESGCNLVMGWDPWEPYQYQITDQGVLGLDVEILTAVLNRADCNISFRRGSWTVLLAQLQSGEVDVLAGATLTPGREEFAWFTDVYRNEEFSLYVAQSPDDERSEQSLAQLLESGFRIGVIEGYMYGEEVAELQNDSQFQDQFVYSSMGETNIALLLDRKLDGIMEDTFVGAAIIRRKNLFDQVERHSMDLPRSGVRFMISRASVDESRFLRINGSLQNLLDEGHISTVLGHYLNP